MSPSASLFLRHFDKLGLVIAITWAACLIAPSPRDRHIEALAAGVERDRKKVDEHMARAATIPPPSPLRGLEARAAALTRLPPAPEKFPEWCTERRIAFVYQVERDPQPPSVHAPPLDLAADASEPGLVRISWRANPACAEVRVLYALERRIEEGPWTRILEPGEATTHEDRAAPFGRPLQYRVISRATVLVHGVEGLPEPLPLDAARVELATELAQPVETFRPFEVRITAGWVADPIQDGNAPSWATLVVRELGAGRVERAKKTLWKVEVGQSIGDSGAVLLGLELRSRPSKFAKVEVEVPVARIRWPDGAEEELTPP